MTTNGSSPTADGIAIIGMKGRFPGAGSVDELWENLKNGVESISTFSERELQVAGVDPSYLNVKSYVNRGSVIEGVDQFDAGFFGYSARDAETIDPQHRVFLECAWESLEDAGYDPDSFPGMIGVFVGSDQSTYLYQIYANVDMSAYGYGGMVAIGNEKDYVATQVSYKMNLRGPSLNIQTSCSTSLVAICVACQNLVHGYCDMAIAGGVAIGIPQKKGYWYQPGGIASPDGHCRPFDASALGTVVGNGVGVVVLKRLSDAIRDRDKIEAVIKGFALNNDGSGKVGYTAPSVDGQTNAIRMAQRMANVEPDTIGYIEAHGTATALGDPIEVAALTAAFRERTDKRQFCAIGSVKSNVGHLSSAAGVTGLIKGVLAVKHGQIPKSLHYERPNPQIDFVQSPFFVATDLLDWPIKGQLRRTGVSSFGVGGTNAHIVLEEAPPQTGGAEAVEKQLLVLSARSAAALENTTDNLIAHLERNPNIDLADVAFTYQIGRAAFPHRRFVVFDRSNRSDLIATLKSRDPQRVISAQTEARDQPVVFMFSGQGTQHVDMGLALYQTEYTFRTHVDACCEILKAEMGLDLREIIYPSGDRDTAAARLRHTAITQPALFTIEYALARLWMEWGIQPKAMLGHSIGEYVAACLAGVMKFEDALSVVAMRGRLMGSMPSGAMLAVPLPEAELQHFLGPSVSLAAVNAPSMCVLAGPAAAIGEIEHDLAARNVACSRLHTSHAFHSGMMDPIILQFTERLRRVKLSPPQIPYLSNVTGSAITPQLATSPDYWAAHLRQTVRFSDNLKEVMAFPGLALLEIGPGRTLEMLARQQAQASSQLLVSSLRSLHEQVDDAAFLRTAVGKLWLGGVAVDWLGMHDENRRIVSLPTYPFERQRFWLGPLETVEPASTQPAVPTQEPWSLVPDATPVAVPAIAAEERRSVATAERKQAAVDVGDWFAIPSWKPAVRAGGSAQNASGRWLVFTDTVGIGDKVAEHLRGLGLPVSTVVRGASFNAAEGRYTIRPTERSDYEKLVKDLRSSPPARILHLWSVDPSPPDLSAIAAFDEAQSRSYYSLIMLAQALAKHGGSAPIQLGAVTDRLQAVVGDEALRSAEATISAACKVISQEYAHLRCRWIDVIPSHARLAESLVDEMSREPFEPIVAYRNGRRWLQVYDPVRLDEAEKRPALLKDGGVYLITGGLGNIGLILAEAIARDVKPKLVLTGRSPFPERNRWDEYVASHGRDATTARIRKLQALEKLGAEVMVVSVDVTDRQRMQVMLAAVEQKWGAIGGVIHGAANLSPNAFGSIRDIDGTNGQSHFGPKGHGLLILDELLTDRPPKFWVLLSSLSAVLGGLGLASYAASNVFLDAEAQRKNAAGDATWISINWDSWDFSPQPAAQNGVITAKEGAQAFRRILSAEARQVVVSVAPLPPRIKQWVRFEAIEQKPTTQPVPAAASPTPSGNGADRAAGAGNGAAASHARPQLSTPYVAPKNDMERSIAEIWQQFLGVQPIGVNDKFFELGGHSLLAIQLLARLREVFDIDIPVHRLFEAPTVTELALSIERDRQVAPAIDKLSADADGDLERALKLVEELSDAEVEALLKETENTPEARAEHA